jgi:holo-[acyl-carrier protein] synthase
VIVGVGVDVVSVGRMRAALERTPRIVERVFTGAERAVASERGSPAASFAVRFAAKEACRKSIGMPIPWRDVEVTGGGGRPPRLRVRDRDDLRFHVSLSHDGDQAIAVVLAETL